MATSKEALQKEYEVLMAGLRALQTEMQKLVSAKQQLTSQQEENTAVKEELERVDEDANVYKLVGPALIKQDLVEARSNVDKRLEYIKGEMDRLENQIKSVQGKMQDKEKEFLKFQKRVQGASA